MPPPAAPPLAPAAGAGDRLPTPKRRLGLLLGVLAAVVAVGAGYFAWETWMAAPPPPPKPKGAPGTSKAAAAVPDSDAAATAPASGPISAALQAREAAAAARSDLRIGTEDTSNRPATADRPPGVSTPSTGVVPLSPGVTATRAVEAMAEASPAFRSFVANVKISGVVGPRSGRTAVALINGRLTRSGEIVDPGLGIYFETVDVEKKQVIFKDRSGATVARRY